MLDRGLHRVIVPECKPDQKRKTGTKTGDRRDVPRVFSQKVKENKCNVPSVPGLWSLVFGLLRLRCPPLGFRNGPALLYVQISRMTIFKRSTSYFACTSPAITAASLSSIWFQPSI